jgi:spermidine synthase
MPGVEELTAVEINPGFLSLIPRYAEIASVLTNPKVHVVVDDGRRWLARHPTLKFDLIVMNTTFHWRAHATNLLSREFLLLARSHLAAGGILHYNTTGSADALKTAFLTFPYGVRFINFATVSDSPLQWNEERFRRAMSAFTIDGRSVVDMTRDADRRAVDSAALLARNLNSRDQYAMESRESVLARLPDARVVTDDNMIPEWNAPRILQIVQILHRRISP